MLDTTRKTITRSAWRAFAVPTAGAVLAMGLSSCSPDEAGSAAVVGDRRISTEQVDAAMTEIKAATAQPLPASQVLFLLVIAPQVIPAAQVDGLGVSEAEARETLAKVNDPDPASVQAVRSALSLNKLQQAQKSRAIERVRQQVLASRPRINPRYGTFDATEVSIVQAQPNWMVRPATPVEAPVEPRPAPPTSGS